MKKQTAIQLSKLMSFVLRHNPEALGISLTEGGWLPLDDMVSAIGRQKRWQRITEAEVRHVVETSDKQRFEIQDEQIRARYGHSRAAKPTYAPVKPPQLLYHGTPRQNLDKIRYEGLKTMGRQYVHLSTTQDVALQVGRRRDQNPALLTIRAQEAFSAGVTFSTPSGGVDDLYLVRALPSPFIDFPE